MLMEKKGKLNGGRGFLADCSAVSPILGFVLLLMILMTAMAIIQSTAVPQWNREVEAKHLDSLKYEVADIGRVVAISASTGNPAKVVLNAGVSYPNYYVLFSPSKASTTINAVPLAINISGNIVLSEQSAAIVVEPNYYYYSRVSLIYEHSAVLREEMNGIVIPESDQSAFSRNSIHLAIIKPNFYSFATTETASIILVPESYGGSQLFSGSIEFECYDENTAKWWNDTLSSIYGSGNVTVSGRNISLSLQNVTLSFSVFSAYAVSGGEVSLAYNRNVARLIPLSQNSFNVSQYSTVILGAKAVDQYGNPVKNANVNVRWSCNDNDSRSGTDLLVSNERGEVWYYFTADVNASTEVTCRIDLTSDSAFLEFEVKVRPFVGECPECTPCPQCPPMSLKKVRGATLVNFICDPGCKKEDLEDVAWIDDKFIDNNNKGGCANQTFNFRLPYSVNSSIKPVLIWKGSCTVSSQESSVAVFLNNNYLVSGVSELEVELDPSTLPTSFSISIACCGQSTSLKTDYIEILFGKN
jgi:hypothetical protein